VNKTYLPLFSYEVAKNSVREIWVGSREDLFLFACWQNVTKNITVCLNLTFMMIIQNTFSSQMLGFSRRRCLFSLNSFLHETSLKAVLRRLCARIVELDGASSHCSNGSHVVSRLIGLSTPIHLCLLKQRRSAVPRLGNHIFRQISRNVP
jgi:hypothetical protein